MTAKFSVSINFALVAAILVMPSCCGECATATDWHRFRGPQGNGIFSAKLDLLPEGPKKLWQVKALPGKGSPVVVGGKIYLCGNAPGMALACLEADSGKNLWTTPLRNDGGNNTTPTVADGKLVYLTQKGRLLIAKASPESLTLLADAQLMEGTTWGPPAISGGKLYVRNESGEVACWEIGESVMKR